jgi:hypothetical protein
MLLSQQNSLRKILLVDVKKFFGEVRRIKRKILKREGCFHGKEDWDLCSQRKRSLWELIFHKVIFELCYLLGTKREHLKKGKKRIQT